MENFSDEQVEALARESYVSDWGSMGERASWDTYENKESYIEAWTRWLALPAMQKIFADVWDRGVENEIRNPFRAEECPFTFAHTKHWCGREGCRES